MATTSSKNFFEKALAWLISEFKKAPSIEQKIAQFGNAVVNEVKKLQANETVAFLEKGFVTIAETIDPALVPLISGIELEFPKLLNLIIGIVGEVSKPIPEQVNDGLKLLGVIKEINGTVYAGKLGTLSAAVQGYVASNNATTVGVIPPAQLLASGTAVHAQV